MAGNIYAYSKKRSWESFSFVLLLTGLFTAAMIIYFFYEAEKWWNDSNFTGFAIVLVISSGFVLLGCEISMWEYKKRYIDKDRQYRFLLEINGQVQEVTDFSMIEEAAEKVYITKEISACRILITPEIAGFYEIDFNAKCPVFKQVYNNFWFRKEKKKISWYHGVQYNDLGNILEDIRLLYNKKMFQIEYYTCSVEDIFKRNS